MITALIKSLRPEQWTKNLLLFAAPIFSLHLFQSEYFIRSTAAFGIFCMVSSGGYILNDLLDIDSDRKHPKKSRRPIASGQLKPSVAVAESAVLAFGGAALGFILDMDFGLICLIYLFMTLIYSVKLKNIVILDVLIIAMAFLIRAIAGTLIIDVEISKWLLVCTIFLSLFLALSKRLNELKALENRQVSTRNVLSEYSTGFLMQLISISAASSVIAYTLYTVDSGTVEKFGTMNLVYTIPFVIYGIFRYLYLIYKTDLGESPELVLLRDRPTLLNILLYFFAVLYILYLKGSYRL